MNTVRRIALALLTLSLTTFAAAGAADAPVRDNGKSDSRSARTPAVGLNTPPSTEVGSARFRGPEALSERVLDLAMAHIGGFVAGLALVKVFAAGRQRTVPA